MNDVPLLSNSTLVLGVPELDELSVDGLSVDDHEVGFNQMAVQRNGDGQRRTNTRTFNWHFDGLADHSWLGRSRAASVCRTNLVDPTRPS